MGGGWLETPQERVEGAATGGHRRGWGAHLSRRLERGSPGDRVRGGGGGQAGGQRDRGQAGRQVGAAERRARAAAAEVVGGGDRETADGRPDDGTWDPEPLQRSPARPPGGQQRPSAWAPCRQHRALVQPVSQSRPDRSRFQKASGAGGGHVGGVRPPPAPEGAPAHGGGGGGLLGGTGAFGNWKREGRPSTPRGPCGLTAGAQASRAGSRERGSGDPWWPGQPLTSLPAGSASPSPGDQRKPGSSRAGSRPPGPALPGLTLT